MTHVYHTTLMQRILLSKKAFEIELTRPEGFEFNSGQNICFVQGGMERYYTPISSPKDSTFKLCIRYVEKGLFTPTLQSAELGCVFKITGPHGYFVFRPSHRPAVFVATGTGIAPFVSMARAGVIDFTLLHGVTNAEDLYYESFFRKLSAKYIPCISGYSGEAAIHSGSFQGRVTDFVQNELPHAEYDFYICGRQEMIRDVTHLVDDLFPGSLIYCEVFF
jgi:NAD(P)H-flavin reductase